MPRAHPLPCRADAPASRPACRPARRRRPAARAASRRPGRSTRRRSRGRLARELRGTSAFRARYVRDVVDLGHRATRCSPARERRARSRPRSRSSTRPRPRCCASAPTRAWSTTVAGDGLARRRRRGGAATSTCAAAATRRWTRERWSAWPAALARSRRGVVRGRRRRARRRERCSTRRRGSDRAPASPTTATSAGVLSAVAVSRGFARDGSPAGEAARRAGRRPARRGRPRRRAQRDGRDRRARHRARGVESPPMARLIAPGHERPSDNFVAEMLLKGLGARFGAAGTTPAGAGVVRARARPLRRASRASSTARASRAPTARPRARSCGCWSACTARRSRAPSGLAGGGRAHGHASAGACAAPPRAGRCRAKTGTLSDVCALAGCCTTTGGRTVAFAFLMNRRELFGARRAQDRMTAAIARLDG